MLSVPALSVLVLESELKLATLAYALEVVSVSASVLVLVSILAPVVASGSLS